MKFKLNPIQHLWIYFGIQSLLLLFLLFMLTIFYPRFSQLVGKMQQQDARRPTIEERLNTASPDQLHKDAFLLLDMNAIGSKTAQTMLENTIKMLGTLCVLNFVLTLWLGICLYKLNRSKGSPS